MLPSHEKLVIIMVNHMKIKKYLLNAVGPGCSITFALNIDTV